MKSTNIKPSRTMIIPQYWKHKEFQCLPNIVSPPFHYLTGNFSYPFMANKEFMSNLTLDFSLRSSIIMGPEFNEIALSIKSVLCGSLKIRSKEWVRLYCDM